MRKRSSKIFAVSVLMDAKKSKTIKKSFTKKKKKKKTEVLAQEELMAY